MTATNVLAAFELLSNLPAFLCVCRDGRIEALNRHGMAMLGLDDPMDAVGQPVDSYLATEYRGFHDELLEMIASEPDGTRLKLAKGLPATDMEIRAILRNRLEDGVHVLYGTDISEKIRDVELLYQRERHYRSIIENAGGMMCEVEDGRIVSINAAGVDLMGIAGPGDLVGRPLSSLFHPEYVELFETELQALCREDSPVPVPLVRADGILRDVEVIVSALDGEVARHLLVEVRDITQQNQAMQALRALNENLEARVEERTRTLREAQQRLSRISKLEAVGTFAGGIAHEICTPIQFLADNLRFLQTSVADLQEIVALYQAAETAATQGQDPLPPLDAARKSADDSDIDFIFEEMPLAIGQSLAGVSHIAKVVQAMRDFSDRRETSLTELDLTSTLNEEVVRLREHLGTSAAVRWSLPEDAIFMKAAPEDLRQAIRNVLENAVQALQSAARADGCIEIELCHEGPTAILTIRDNGVGMTEEVATRAFDPFFTTREVGDGIGQGLAIAHHIVTDRHGGEIWLQSAPGAGCHVFMKFPCEAVAREPQVYEPVAVGRHAET